MGSADSPRPPGRGDEPDPAETIDAPIAANPPPRLPVHRMELPVYRPRDHRARRLWFMLAVGVAAAVVVAVLVLLA